MSIFVRLSGGLGNQMFQYALGYQLAKKNQTNLIIDLDWFHNIPDGSSYQKERLSLLKCNPNFINSNGNIKDIPGVKHNNILAYFSKNKISYKEKQHYIFDSKVLNLRDGQYIDGYWQSYKYFSELDELRELFKPNKELHYNTLEFLEILQNKNSVMLHIRRGDYAHSTTANQFHGLQPLSYYQKALEIINNQIENPIIIVFSDDIEWAKTHLKINSHSIFIDNIQDPDNVIDELYLMSQCKHQIIANSSLSWWGAWLNNNKNKIVIAPHQWLIKNPSTLEDLIPNDWKLI